MVALAATSLTSRVVSVLLVGSGLLVRAFALFVMFVAAWVSRYAVIAFVFLFGKMQSHSLHPWVDLESLNGFY